MHAVEMAVFYHSLKLGCELKKRIVMVLLFFLMVCGTVLAQVRGDFGITVLTPVRYIQLEAFNTDVHNVLADNHGPLPLPFAQIAYMINLDVVDIGLGYRAWIEGPILLFPVIFADMTVARIMHIEASIGGGLTTLLNPIEAPRFLPLPLLISEFGMYIKVFESFQTGVSCIVPMVIADKPYLSCVLCATLRFVLDDF